MKDARLKALLTKYLNGNCTEDEKIWVERWLAYHEVQTPDLDWTERQWLDFDNALQQVTDEITSGNREVTIRPNVRRNLVYQVAASLLIIISSSLIFFAMGLDKTHRTRGIRWAERKAEKGTTVHLVLEDSTEVWLNAGSIIRYPNHFSSKLREAVVVEGEAYFKIRHEDRRGFQVISQVFNAFVLGTSFSITSYQRSSTSSITVFTGKVGVISKKRQDLPTLFLSASHQATFDKIKGGLVDSTSHMRHSIDWVNGELNFKKDQFGDIAIRLENYFNVSISFVHPKARRSLLSGHFGKGKPLERILGELCMAQQEHFKKMDAGHYIIL